MANIYDDVKSNITADMISNAAIELGENNIQVRQAARSVVPTLLAMVMERGDSKKVQDVLQEAHDKNLLDDREQLCSAGADATKLAVGERFVQAAAGDKEPALNSLLASDQVMSNANTRRLLSMIGAVTAGTLGKKLHAHGGSMPKLLDELGKERNAIMADIPQEWKSRLGIRAAAPAGTTAKAVDNTKKKNSWIWWVVVIVILVILFFLLRGCKGCSRQTEPKGKAAVVEQTTPVKPATTTATERETYELTLPNGKKLTVYKGGMEYQMIEYLKSDSYKNATDKELRDHWFEFDGIDFVFDSGTELQPGSKRQVENLAAILEYYPDTKVKIGGFADNVGGKKVNMAISEQRANTIKKLFEQAGIAANRVSTEGFGKEFATVPANATDAERAPDRDIALRFTK